MEIESDCAAKSMAPIYDSKIQHPDLCSHYMRLNFCFFFSLAFIPSFVWFLFEMSTRGFFCAAKIYQFAALLSVGVFLLNYLGSARFTSFPSSWLLCMYKQNPIKNL